ncbi:hypothetical protein [Ligilactobacillus acidipiscis]|uniref:hypothetical protein n=1 Tax=Ligilactobacillus acidipiscis TaxID=89059 RepID=UPI0023F9C95A|nr:hypothetical protein [Ligilactobacillus acidipiscis]WEV56689.1 hypothetical protein OZX66_10760 [Ligilactobacillus acidipiscis]
MNDRRLISRQLLINESFTSMSAEARELYHAMSAFADDDGMVEDINMILYLTRLNQGALNELIKNEFIFEFKLTRKNVYVLVDWHTYDQTAKGKYNITKNGNVLLQLGIDEEGIYYKLADHPERENHFKDYYQKHFDWARNAKNIKNYANKCNSISTLLGKYFYQARDSQPPRDDHADTTPYELESELEPEKEFENERYNMTLQGERESEGVWGNSGEEDQLPKLSTVKARDPLKSKNKKNEPIIFGNQTDAQIRSLLRQVKPQRENDIYTYLVSQLGYDDFSSEVHEQVHRLFNELEKEKQKNA